MIAGLNHVAEYACHKLRAPYGIATLQEGQQLLTVVNKAAEQLASSSVGVVCETIKEITAVMEVCVCLLLVAHGVWTVYLGSFPLSSYSLFQRIPFSNTVGA